MFIHHSKPILVLLVIGLFSIQANSTVLTLDMAIKAAQKNDPWLAGNRHTQQAIEAKSIAVGTMDDPKVSIGLANFPLDSFDFSRDNMTQFKVGVSQKLPRGNSLALRQNQLKLRADQYPLQRQNRQATVAVNVAKLWLDAYKAQQSIGLIEQNKTLFEQLADVAQASYSSAVGKTRQQDIIRAQLELTRIDDRLMVLKQQKETISQELAHWLDDHSDGHYSDHPMAETALTLSGTLPDIGLSNPQLYQQSIQITPKMLLDYFVGHPAIKAVEQKIKVSDSGIDLAKQKLLPQWELNASYGYRNNTPTGNGRADLFSIGVSFDVPLFTDNRQDKEVLAAVSEAEAVKTMKWHLLRKFISSYTAAKAQLQRLNQRQALYNDRLLPQMHEQTETSLSAYTADDGRFSEVVRARIAQLTAEIDALGIDVERQKTIIQLNYFFVTATGQEH